MKTTWDLNFQAQEPDRRGEKSFTLISVVLKTIYPVMQATIGRCNLKSYFLLLFKTNRTGLWDHSQYLSQDRWTQQFPQAGHSDLLQTLVSAVFLAAALNLLPGQTTCEQHFSIAIPYTRLMVLIFCAYCSSQAIVLSDIAVGLSSGSMILAR